MSKSLISFRGFNEHRPVRIYDQGDLPHWRQAGCTYFVTFRLADSLPRRALEEMEYERALWLIARKIDPVDPNWRQQLGMLPLQDRMAFFEYMDQKLDERLDACEGSCVLQNPSAATTVATALEHFHDQRVLTGDFVVMPNHVHALLMPMNGFELEDVLHSIKSFTAKEINRFCRRSGRLWQRESYDRIVRDERELEAIQQYIRDNPAKARLTVGSYVYAPASYVW